jgi:DNA-binding transcriptional LysR family regulator
MNITFRQLRVFTEVAAHGSMARAAEALHLTPPAVSMQIKEIEGQVGLPLFDREGRAVALSTAGGP